LRFAGEIPRNTESQGTTGGRGNAVAGSLVGRASTRKRGTLLPTQPLRDTMIAPTGGDERGSGGGERIVAVGFRTSFDR
jgi:hypothetical protein